VLSVYEGRFGYPVIERLHESSDMDRDPLLLENNVSPEHPLAELGRSCWASR